LPLGAEGERDDRADTGRAHQPADAAVLASQRSQALPELLPLPKEHIPGRQRRFCNRRQCRMAGDQLADAARKGSRRCRADLQPKAAQHPAQAHLDVMVLALQKFACRQQGPHLLRRQRLAVNRAEPAEPHELSDAARILAIRLDRHRLERVPDVPSFEQLDRQACVPHAAPGVPLAV
jgi:hypothetical protein